MLGRLSARRGEETIDRFATSRTAALLARLALHPQRTHPREELIDLLWPQASLDAGRLSLRVAAASLRRQLEPPQVRPGSILLADRSSLRLNPLACRTDVSDFEAALRAAARTPSPDQKRAFLEQAIGLYGGELLPGLYDEWVQDERERLTALYEEACVMRGTLPAPFLPSAPSLSQQAEEQPATMRGFPLRLTRFFGREAERAALRDWRQSSDRLATLTGPGGSGKTRLAAEAAQEDAANFGGPRCFGLVCFVGLADLEDARQIPQAVADVLGLPRTAAGEPLEQVVTALTAQPPALLVLDNFEHLVDRGASVVLSLLTRLPTLRCLVTSRRRLALPGEREFPLSPLPVPDAAGSELPAQVAQADSVRLFVDRAQAARPDFQITRSNAAAVADLCRLLEGIPLALELVATRAQALSPAQMRDRLTDRFTLLTHRPGTGRHQSAGRHQSVWAAIAWSYDLLGPDLQRFFAELSIFRGGWTAEAAQAVCEQPQALEFLTQLRERSLIVLEEAPTEMRFRMLETLREFAAEHLAADEKAALSRRHALFFRDMAEAAAPCLIGPEQVQWQDKLEADRENLHLALSEWQADENGVQDSLQMARSLWRFWAVRGHNATGRERLAAALARPGGMPRTRARTANAAGNLARTQGDYDAAEAYFSEALALVSGLDDACFQAVCMGNLGMVATQREEYTRAQELHEQALSLHRQIGDQPNIALALQCLGLVAYHQRDYRRARPFMEEALALCCALGQFGGQMWGLSTLGAMAYKEGDLDEAERLQREAMTLCLTLQNGEALSCLLASFAELVLHRDQAAQAATLLGASEAMQRRAGYVEAPREAVEMEQIVKKARAALPPADFAAHWAQGAALTPEEAVALALSEGNTSGGSV